MKNIRLEVDRLSDFQVLATFLMVFGSWRVHASWPSPSINHKLTTALNRTNLFKTRKYLFYSPAIGRDLWIRFSLSNFLEKILQPTSFKNVTNVELRSWALIFLNFWLVWYGLIFKAEKLYYKYSMNCDDWSNLRLKIQKITAFLISRVSHFTKGLFLP